MSTTTIPQVTPVSRAALRRVEAGNMAICTVCNQQVKFMAKLNRMQVIANVYVDGRWNRVEHFHDECYDEASSPYGDARADTTPSRRSAPVSA